MESVFGDGVRRQTDDVFIDYYGRHYFRRVSAINGKLNAWRESR